MWASIIVLIIAIIALIKSADIAVKTLTRIAIFFKLSEFIIGFLVLAIATSIPELMVAITAASAKIPSLSLGDVLGANIVNLTLVIGVVILLSRGMRIKSEIARKDFIYIIMLSVLPLILMLDRVISRVDGAVLLAVFCLYLFKILGQRKSFRKKFDHTSKKAFFADLILLGFSLAVLLFAVKVIVDFAAQIATEMLIPPFLIGVLMLAIGTTLPELSSAIMATLSKLQEMAIGDLLGSVVVNSTLVIGVAALIYPITASFILFAISAVFMTFSLCFFAYLAHTGKKIPLQAGVFLIILYILFVMLQIGAKLGFVL